MKILETIGKQKKLLFWLLLFWLTLLLYAFWSYTQTDRNLVLTSFTPYWNFQVWLWQIAASNRPLVTGIFTFLIGSLFIIYYQLNKLFLDKKWYLDLNSNKIKLVVLTWFVVISPLLFSYNALSHDVFNYIFNARMVVKYQQDPHVKVALDFKDDLWVRFMHNTHTPAPYFYGWTGLSILPYLLGAGKFSLTWLAFRLFALLSLGLFFGALLSLFRKLNWPIKLHQLGLLFFNPLLLIEIVSNSHNDVWMMGLALISISLLVGKTNKKLLLLSFVLLLFSVSIKYATLLLLPVWLVFCLLSLIDQVIYFRFMAFRLLFKKVFEFLLHPLFFLSSLLMFSFLFLDRSRQFLPWYLLWSFVWLTLILAGGKNSLMTFLLKLPFLKGTFLAFFKKISVLETQIKTTWSLWLLAFSFSSLLRYVPWLLSGEYLSQTNTQEKLVTWAGGILFFTLGLIAIRKFSSARLLLQ